MAKESINKYFALTSFMVGAQAVRLALGLATSIIIARHLGPKGQGIYSLIIIFVSLAVSIFSMGIGPATMYYVARKEFDLREVLNNNIFLGSLIGVIGVAFASASFVFLKSHIFEGIPQEYLQFSLVLIPVQIIYMSVIHILLGDQKIKEFNVLQVGQSLLLLVFIAISVVVLESGVLGAIKATLAAFSVSTFITFWATRNSVGGIRFSINYIYIKKILKYGAQAHLSNLLSMLNYRLDIFLLNDYMGPTAVGYYTIAVGLVERLWMLSHAASMLLFPRVAAEKDTKKLKEFTPKVVKTIIWITAIIVIMLAAIGHWVVAFLYSDAYLPAVGALRALSIGVIMLSASRILASDIAGRGFPIVNAYRGIVVVFTNVILNIIFIPLFGIIGAAWASSISYTLSFLTALYFYSRFSGNPWHEVVFLKREDWQAYKMVFNSLTIHLAKNFKHMFKN